jgi:SAM-dependent methyltransferase
MDQRVTTVASKQTTVPPGIVPPPDYAAVKQRQQATWASGDYAVIGSTLQIVGESLAEAADVRAGERVLDVAAGNGNASLAAARRFAQVTSVDYVPLLLEKAKHRAIAEGFEIRFQVEDAEALPFEGGSFDVALSTFGAMFAPDQHQVARELIRVVRSGGRIAMANWTPEGFIGRLFRIIAGYVPPPAGVSPPSLWGTEPRIVELFGHAAADIRCTRRHFNFRYRSAAHWLDIFTRFYGPMFKVYAALDASAQARLTGDITALIEELNIGGTDSMVVPSEYLEVIVQKQ